MSGPALRDFRCTHGKGWAEDTWTRIGPESFNTPHTKHVNKAHAEAKARRDFADDSEERSRLAAEHLGVDLGPDRRADLLRTLADAGEADAAGHTQVRCPTCGFTERMLHRDHVTLSEWCGEVGLDCIPLRSVRRVLVELGIV